MHQGIREPAAKESLEFLNGISSKQINCDLLNESRLTDITEIAAFSDQFMRLTKDKAEWYTEYEKTNDASSVDRQRVNVWKNELLKVRDHLSSSVTRLQSNLRCKKGLVKISKISS
jgi:hypothetical protein